MQFNPTVKMDNAAFEDDQIQGERESEITMAEEKEFIGTVHVCAHRVTFWYDLEELSLSDELRDQLTTEAEDRAKYSISEGYVSGELNCLYIDHENDKDYEVRGGWEIEQ